MALGAVHDTGPYGSHFKLEQLKQFWTSVRPAGIKGWSKVRGGIGAAEMTLRRLSWSFASPFTLITDQGVNISLTSTSPGALKTWLGEAVQRIHQRKFGAGLDEADFPGVRASVAVPRAVATGKKHGLSCHEAAALRGATLGGTWTKTRLHLAGYEVDDLLCPLCGQGQDCLWHRVWFCEHKDVAAARCEAAPQWLIRKARAAPDHEELKWTRGILQHGEELLKPPVMTGGSKLEVCDEEQWEATRSDGMWWFSDGSCSREMDVSLNRAAWSVVFYNARTWEKAAVASGPVWATLLQTSQAGEFAAYAAARQIGKTMAAEQVGVTDCSSVVAAVNADVEDRLGWRKKCAGVMRDTLEYESGAELKDMLNVRSHTALSSASNAREEFMWKGNDCADQEAKEAVKEHWKDVQDEEELEKWRQENKEVAMVCKVIGKTLAQFPCLDRKCTQGRVRRSGGEKFRQRRIDVDHSWLYVNGLWRCRQCGHFKYGDESTSLEPGNCPGWEKGLNTKFCQPDNFHEVVRVEQKSIPFYFCARCGGHGSVKMQLLSRECRGQPAGPGQRSVLNAFTNGFNPITKIRFTNVCGLKEFRRRRGFSCVDTADDADEKVAPRRVRTAGNRPAPVSGQRANPKPRIPAGDTKKEITALTKEQEQRIAANRDAALARRSARNAGAERTADAKVNVEKKVVNVREPVPVGTVVQTGSGGMGASANPTTKPLSRAQQRLEELRARVVAKQQAAGP